MKPIKLFFVLFFALSLSILAQQKEDYSKYPGYFDYKEFAPLKNAEPTTEVYLEEPLLKMAAGVVHEKKGDVGNMIGGLKLVRVNEFKIEKSDIPSMENAIESMDKTLQSKNWDRIIRTKTTGNFTNVYVKKGANDEYLGLTLVSLDKKMGAHNAGDNDNSKESVDNSGKVTFVNIVGKIDLSTLGNLSEQLNIPEIDKAKKEKH